MDHSGASTEFIFQGSVYFFRAQKILCRFQMSLRDEVDPQLLQKALDSVLERAEYFRRRLVWEKNSAYLVPNEEPCLVYRSARQPEIPEDTNGYLFSVSCAGNTVYFDWFHFLTDGFGAGQFMTQLLIDYCNLRYGTRFSSRALVSSPMYSLEDLARRHEETRVTNDFQQKVTETCEGALRRIVVRLDKGDLVHQAQHYHVKPFSLLLALLCQVMRPYVRTDTVSFSYPMDMRKAVGAPEALYNCVSSGRQGGLRPEGDFGAFLAEVDRRVKDSLVEDTMLVRMAQQMGWVYEVFQLRAPLKIKKRVFQMGEYASGVPSDFWISYVGSPLHTGEASLADYLTDYQVWVPPEGASLGIEEVSLNGKLILCLQDKTGQDGLCDTLRSVMAAHGIRVLDVEMPDALARSEGAAVSSQ